MTTQTHLLANTYCTTFVVIIQVRIPIKLYSINIINLVKLYHMYFLVISQSYMPTLSIPFAEPSYHKVGTFNVKRVLNITGEILWVKDIPSDSPECGFENDLCAESSSKSSKLF